MGEKMEYLYMKNRRTWKKTEEYTKKTKEKTRKVQLMKTKRTRQNVEDYKSNFET